MDFDIVLVGGGLANGLVALRLSQLRPDVSIAVVEAGNRIGGNHIWSSFEQDLSPAQRAWTEPLIAHRWQEYSVRFPKGTRTLRAGYRTATSGLLADAVEKALPDGHTLLLGTAGMLVINELIYSKMPFDPATAFAPITLVADMPLALTVNPKTKLSSVKGKPEMIESFAKQGADLDGNTPAEFDAFIKQERVKWGPVARQLTLKMD